ncbi:L-rhamnose-binding lectin ELEL-1-like [Rhodnius prolixus]|uniref:L-rhamnose-binding lectin ELEL-1-like n=1 Tax=Rhodnius prolixus TaxID=13249 RepID=UPI003D18A03B
MRKMIKIRLVLLSVLLSIIKAVSGAPTSSMACEDYTLNISCPDGYYLDIVNAFYGRKDENICYRKGKIINTNCSAQTALAVMHSRCNNFQICIVSASKTVFGDPCYDTYKYLEVEYNCIKRN